MNKKKKIAKEIRRRAFKRRQNWLRKLANKKRTPQASAGCSN